MKDEQTTVKYLSVLSISYQMSQEDLEYEQIIWLAFMVMSMVGYEKLYHGITNWYCQRHSPPYCEYNTAQNA